MALPYPLPLTQSGSASDAYAINNINNATGLRPALGTAYYHPSTDTAVGSDTATDPNDTSLYNGGGDPTTNYWKQQQDLIDYQIGRLPGQEDIGRKNILDSYTSAFNTLTNNKSRDERNYTTNRNQAMDDNRLARSGIRDMVSSRLTGLMRLLGGRGSGSSSAAELLAPYAAGREGSVRNNQVAQAYGRNMGALDTSWQDANEGYDTSFGQLGADKTNKESSLLSNLASTRIKLLSAKQAAQVQAGQSPDPALTDEIKRIGDEVDSYGAQQVFTPKAVTYNSPDLEQYNYDQLNAARLGGNDSALTQNVSPFWSLLRGKKFNGSTA